MKQAKHDPGLSNDNMKQSGISRIQFECNAKQFGRSPFAITAMARLTAIMLILVLTLSLGACGTGTPETVSSSAPAAAETAATPAPVAETAKAAEPEATAVPETTAVLETTAAPETSPVAISDASSAQAAIPTEDRAGNPISVPAEVKTIISLAPSFTESLIAMGLVDRIVAIDQNAAGLAGVKKEWPVFDLMAPDAEKLLKLNPDVIIATPMSTGGGEDPFKLLKDAGICVVYVPSSDSIQGIKDDLLFLGALMGVQDKAVQLLDKMQAGIDEVAAVGKTITDKKRVYFEIGAAPSMYSFGSGVFLNEMLELIGAVNVFADQKSWVAVSQEAALAANPDVILTNVNYIPDAIGEIKARDGWSAVKAVKDGNVFYIDNMSSSLPNQGIVKALHEMAKAVYPGKY
jgi:iron complex transport system substrate-binding protein